MADEAFLIVFCAWDSHFIPRNGMSAYNDNSDMYLQRRACCLSIGHPRFFPLLSIVDVDLIY